MNLILYRILGNPLPPRHHSRNTLDNLRFVLEHETELPGCEKRWILNGIADRALSEACHALIARAGHACLDIPFDSERYRHSFLDSSGLPALGAAPTPMALRLRQEWIYRHKSLAAIDLNRARNRAIELGSRDADWVLPLDGGTFFTPDGWQAFADAVRHATDALYALIPMFRLDSNRDFREMDATHYQPEPQIAFRRDAPDRFDPRLRYGNRNKAELLARLQVPGPWQQWRSADWETDAPMTAIAPGRFIEAGRIYRLQTGATPDVEAAESVRHQSRFQGVAAFTAALDAALLTKRLDALAHAPWLLPADTAMPSAATGADMLCRIERAAAQPELAGDCLGVPFWAETGSNRGTLAPAEYAGIRQALAALLDTLENSANGQAINHRADALGTRNHLLKVLLALYLRRDADAARLLHNAPLRLVAQCAQARKHPDAAVCHPQNLIVWFLLARVAAMAGVDIAAFRGVAGESLAALRAMADAHAAASWPQGLAELLDTMQTGAHIPADCPAADGLPALPADWPLLWTQWAP